MSFKLLAAGGGVVWFVASTAFANASLIAFVVVAAIAADAGLRARRLLTRMDVVDERLAEQAEKLHELAGELSGDGDPKPDQA